MRGAVAGWDGGAARLGLRRQSGIAISMGRDAGRDADGPQATP